ncbi:MAG TPA: hypothetical protein VK619_16440 [Pyrinomonadaceae bacterium]|nr:hypothetical protein [Pyrinomonadaceae bacterium]
MPAVTQDFDGYKIFYYSSQPYEANIYCYKAGNYVGRMVFFKDASSIPPNTNAGGTPSVHYPLTRFNDVIGILRYEKPLYLFLNLDNLMGHVATASVEPTGEEEP